MKNELVEVRNGKVVCNSLMVAEKFGKEHFNVLRDIENLECSQEFRAINFEVSSYKSKQGKELPMFEMTRDGFTFLAMGFTGKEAAEWKEKYINAFNAMEEAVKNNYRLNTRNNLEILVDNLLAAEKIAKFFNLDENHAKLKANSIVAKTTGVDCIKEFDIPALEYKQNIQYHTPSVLGDMCGISSVKMNKILEEKGLQKETRDHKKRLVWVVTDKGKNFSRMFDTGKTHTDGSPIQQIKWSEAVLELIQ